MLKQEETIIYLLTISFKLTLFTHPLDLFLRGVFIYID